MQTKKDMPTKDTQKRIIANIQTEIEKSDAKPHMLISAGSSRNDIDLFVVLSDNNKFHRPLQNLLNSVSTVQENLKKKGIILSVFPQLNRKIPDKKFVQANKNDYSSNHQQLHLLMYPSYDLFVEWEGPMMVKRVAKSSNMLIGDKKELDDRVSQLEIPSFEDRICSANLLLVLINNYQMIKCSEYPEETTLEEATEKTEYVIRYLSFDHLLRNGYEIDDLLSWHSIYQHSDNLSSPLDTMCETAYDWWKHDIVGNKKILKEMNEKCLNIIESELTT